MSHGDQCKTPGCNGIVTDGGALAARCKECRARIKASDPKMLRREERIAWSTTKKYKGCKGQMAMRSDQPYVPVKLKCKVCCDQPWARGEGRKREYGSSLIDASYYNKADKTWRCVGCHETYQDEPKASIQSTLRSSSAFVAEHGELHGHKGGIPLNPHNSALNKSYRLALRKRNEKRVESATKRLLEDDE